MRQVSAAILFVLISASAHAEAAQTPGQSCIAVGQGYSRVVATLSDPQQCCTGRMQCAQYLSTTTVVRPAHDRRT